MPPPEKDQPGTDPFKRIGLVFLVILLLTTFLSAFCAFQANSWSSITSGKYQEATRLRTDSVKAYNDGNTRLLIDISVYITWADAATRGETARAQTIASRFTPEFKNAFQAWRAETLDLPSGTIPNGTPFTRPEYHLVERDRGVLLEENATAAFIEAQQASDVSSGYILTTLIFAIVLFLCGVGEKWEDRRLRIVILAAAVVFFCIAAAMVIRLPKSF
jgi:hypothetical protein